MPSLVQCAVEGERVERETGFEPATPSLEGWRSTAELFPPDCRAVVLERRATYTFLNAEFSSAESRVPHAVAALRNAQPRVPQAVAPFSAHPRCEPDSWHPVPWWGGEDLNPRRRTPADLQSAPFGHLGTSPNPPAAPGNSSKKLALAGGFEPPTYCLQGSCSAPELRQHRQKVTLGLTFR